MPDDIHDTLAKTLADIRARLGTDAFEDRRKVLALLADALHGHNRQLRLLGIAYDNGSVRAIATARADQAELEIDRHAQRVDADLGIRKSIMVPVLRAVAFAAGRGGLPSLYSPAATSELVRPDPEQEESWVGTTQDPPPALVAHAASAFAPPQQPAPALTPTPPPQPLEPQSEPAAALHPQPQGLGGLLIVWPLALMLAALVLGFYAASGFVRLFDVLDYEPSIMHTGLVVVPSAIAVLALLALALLWLHFRRSKRARLANCLWLLALAGLPFAGDGTKLTDYSVLRLPMWMLLPPVAMCVVGLGYFLFSRRARNTFVR